MSEHPHPPKWANKFLEWLCSSEVIETVQGDLLELYEKRKKAKGKTKANLHFIGDVLSVIRPFARKKSRHNSNSYAMFKNYYKVAIRNLVRHKMYSSIKIGGLAIAIAACILISLFILNELKYDTSYKDGDRIYRIINNWNEEGSEYKWPSLPAPMAEIIRNQIPEVETVGRIIPYNFRLGGHNLFRPSDQTNNSFEGRFVYADQELIDILSLSFLHGKAKTALTEPNSLVISKQKADKFFPGKNPVGQTISLNDDKENLLTISGVIETLPSTSHLNFDFIISLAGRRVLGRGTKVMVLQQL